MLENIVLVIMILLASVIGGFMGAWLAFRTIVNDDLNIMRSINDNINNLKESTKLIKTCLEVLSRRIALHRVAFESKASTRIDVEKQSYDIPEPTQPMPKYSSDLTP